MSYNVCPDPVNLPGLGFSLTGALLAGSSTVASGTDAACTTDYLMIPCGSNVQGQAINSDGTTCATRLCGSAFNTINAQTIPTTVFSKFQFHFIHFLDYSFCYLLPISARSVPFELRFFSNALEARDGDQGNLGFCLTYQQLPCPVSANNFLNMII